MPTPRLRFFKRPNELPELPATGRLVMLDVAFAAWGDYDAVTRPFIQAAGDRLRGWIDHHRHPAWPDYASDERFVLVPRKEAPGCPQLVTEGRVAAIGSVEHVWAHADFDGCLAAAKFLNGGSACYAEMDEDARAMDSPGWGFVCSDGGLRLNRAMEYKAIVAMIREPGHSTVATYHSEQGPGLKLNSLDGLRGPEGYAFGSPKPAKLLPEIVRLIEAYRAGA